MKKVIVTTSWDDGHKLDVRLAELLKKYDIQGTFYVAPKNHEQLTSDTLNDHQIKEISSSFEIGAHTIVHKALTTLPDDVAFSEINDSKKYLEKVTGKVINSFCYPLGKYKSKHIKMVKDVGFTYARTVRRHSTETNGNPLEAETSVHTYNHWSDIWKILRFSGFNIIKAIKYFQWDNLAREMFDRTLENGGVFHLWGHSWEIDKHNDWNKLEKVLKYISKKSGVDYVCNGDLIDIKFPKKVIIVAPYFLPHIGGVEFYVYNIARKLQSEFGWDVCVVTTADSGEKTTIEYFEGMKVYRLSYWFKLSNAPLNVLWPIILRSIFKVERANLINVHAPVPGLPDIGAWVSGDTPVVVTYHAGSMKKGKILPDIIIWLYENAPLKWLLNIADRIVCSSDFVRNDFLQKFNEKSITITPGVNTVQFKPAIIPATTNNTVLFVAGLSRSQQFKGLMLLMDAIKKVSENIPTIRLIVVGEGDMRTEYEEYSEKLGLGNAIIFAGKLTGELLVQAYQQANVFVLPSSSPAESFGMVLVEAMACGKPVIGTNLGGIPNVIDNEKNGILIPEKNVNALANAIERVLSDQNLADSFGKNGLEKALSKFDWETRVCEYNDLFSSFSGRMKNHVVQIVGYYPPHTGGMEVVAKEISLELSRRNYPVTVLTSDVGAEGKVVYEDEVKQNYLVKHLRCLEIAHTPLLWSLPLHLLNLPSRSILHVHVAHAWLPEIAFIVAKLRRFSFVAHYHLDVGPSGSLGWILPFYKKYFLGLVLRNADKVIVFSDEQRVLLQEKYTVRKEHIAIIPNGVKEEFFFHELRQLPKERLQLLYVGRLSVQKRVERLIDALALLRIPVHLTIVGDGEDREKLEARASELGVITVSFEGRKSGDELRGYYRKADAFVISSDIEGMPLVVIEAMASGLPIIASDVVGLRELVKDVGVLVSNPSSETFAEALTSLWNNPEQLHALSKKSLLRAEQLSWGNLVSRLEEVYEEIQNI